VVVANQHVSVVHLHSIHIGVRIEDSPQNFVRKLRGLIDQEQL